MTNPFYEIDPLVHESTLIPLSPKDLQSACWSNRMYHDICQDDMFWKQKFFYDFKTDMLANQDLSYKEKWIACNNWIPISIDFIISVRKIPIEYMEKVNARDYVTHIFNQLCSHFTAGECQDRNAKEALQRARTAYPDFDINDPRRIYEIYIKITKNHQWYDEILVNILELQSRHILTDIFNDIKSYMLQYYPDAFVINEDFTYKLYTKGPRSPDIYGTWNFDYFLSHQRIMDKHGIHPLEVIINCMLNYGFPQIKVKDETNTEYILGYGMFKFTKSAVSD